jgi:predicted enzyme related to lactoylglutathione lyase
MLARRGGVITTAFAPGHDSPPGAGPPTPPTAGVGVVHADEPRLVQLRNLASNRDHCVGLHTAIRSRRGIRWRARRVWEAAAMSVKRVVPDLASQSLENAKQFYGRVLDLELVMDLGWIVTLADPNHPAAQISFMTHDATAPLIPGVSIEVDDVDAVHAAAVREGAEIVHPLTDEPWGVRRFFLRDPDGTIVNVLSHR